MRARRWVRRIAPVPTRVVDTFAVGFLYGLTSRKPLDVFGWMAATMASDVISLVGAVVSDEVLARESPQAALHVPEMAD